MNTRHAVSEILAIVFVALAFFTLKAPAHELNSSTGLVCDTKEQVSRFYTLFLEGDMHAMQRVNAEAKATACMVGTVAYIKGEVVGTFPVPEGRIDVVKVVVTAYVLNGAWMELQPTVQYVPYFQKEEGV